MNKTTANLYHYFGYTLFQSYDFFKSELRPAASSKSDR
ncbi:hypothetical protein DSUL_50432 [Desulfovibrionales bacterium]